QLIQGHQDRHCPIRTPASTRRFYIQALDCVLDGGHDFVRSTDGENAQRSAGFVHVGTEHRKRSSQFARLDIFDLEYFRLPVTTLSVVLPLSFEAEPFNLYIR